MGLRERFTAYAVGTAHVQLVEVPGWWTTRAAVERGLAARGWRAALSPADADVLVVCGEPGERLRAAIDRVWDQLPGPRARVTARTADGAAEALTVAAGLLGDEGHQRADAATRSSAFDDESRAGRGDMGHDDMGRGDMGPAGIPLASGGADRDGLEMDVLHVPLGPVLPHWPAGLVLRCSLQGDVVTAAHVEVLGAGAAPPATPGAVGSLRAARRCDGVTRLLALAGWADAATASRRTRDAVLAGLSRHEAAEQLERLSTRVSRSTSLRWLLRGLARIDDGALVGLGLPTALSGDVHDRLVAMLRLARDDLFGRHIDDADATLTLAALPGLVTGLDVAAVRLVVASLDPDTAGVRREAVRA